MSYQKRIRRQYQQALNEHLEEINQFACLDPECEKLSDVEGALCGWCERRLTELCKLIDPTIKRLTIIGETEAYNISRLGNDTNGFARVGEAVNLTPATLLADELDALATQFARHAILDRGSKQQWHGYPGAFLYRIVPYLARQPWVMYLLNGYQEDGYWDDDKRRWEPGEVVRGLEAIMADVRAKFPPDTQDSPPRPLPFECFQCGQKNVWLHPAQAYRQDVIALCATEDAGIRCGWMVKEDVFEWLAKMIPIMAAIEAEKRRQPTHDDDTI